MKIIELFNKTANEAIGSAIGGAVKGIAKGADEFIKGASGGEVDIGGTIKKYTNIDDTKGTTRSVGRELPPEQRFDNLMVVMYGNDLTQKIKNDWEDAIKSKDATKIKNINNDYKRFLKPTAKDIGDKLKKSNKQAVADMAGLRPEDL